MLSFSVALAPLGAERCCLLSSVCWLTDIHDQMKPRQESRLIKKILPTACTEKRQPCQDCSGWVKSGVVQLPSRGWDFWQKQEPHWKSKPEMQLILFRGHFDTNVENHDFLTSRLYFPLYSPAWNTFSSPGFSDGSFRFWVKPSF